MVIAGDGYHHPSDSNAQADRSGLAVLIATCPIAHLDDDSKGHMSEVPCCSGSEPTQEPWLPRDRGSSPCLTIVSVSPWFQLEAGLDISESETCIVNTSLCVFCGPCDVIV